MCKTPNWVGTLAWCVLCVWTVHASVVSNDQNSNNLPDLKGTFADRPNQMVQIHPWFRTSSPQKISMIYRTKTTTQVSLRFITKQTTLIKPAPTVTSTEYIPVTITDTEYLDAEPITSTVTLTVPLVFTTTRMDPEHTVTLTMPGAAHTVTTTMMADSPCHQDDLPQRISKPGNIFDDTMAHIAKLQAKVSDLLAIMTTSKMRTNGRQQLLFGRLERISWGHVLNSVPVNEKQKQFDWSIDQLDAMKMMLVMQDMGQQNGAGFFSMLEMFVNNLERMY